MKICQLLWSYIDVGLSHHVYIDHVPRDSVWLFHIYFYVKTPGFESKALGTSPPVWRSLARLHVAGEGLEPRPTKALICGLPQGSAKLLVGHWKPGHRWVPPRLLERLSLRKPVDLEPMKKQIKTIQNSSSEKTKSDWNISPNGSPWTPWKTDTRHSVTASQRHQSFQRLCTRESAMNLFSVQQGWFNGDLWRMYGGFLCHGVTLKSSKVRQTILVYVSIETHACGIPYFKKNPYGDFM